MLDKRYNPDVQFVSCSATIANPLNLMVNMFGLRESDVEVVDRDGSPMGERKLVVWNPPYKNEKFVQEGRVNYMDEAVRIVAWLIRRGVRVICFAKVESVSYCISG